MVEINRKPACDCSCNREGENPSERKPDSVKQNFMIGSYTIGEETVPLVSTSWSRTDRLSALKVRWSIGRLRYKVSPGIYAVG